jgi:hypothetical protein
MTDVPKATVSLSRNEEGWGYLEVFVLIQYLSQGGLLLPGTQSIRFAIRALPYVASLGLLIWYGRQRPSWKEFPGTYWLLSVIALLIVEMLHPDTAPIAGLAQIVFTMCIAAPAFWVGKVVHTKWRLDRILYLAFLANAAGAIVGFLQARYNLLMPAHFSHQLNTQYFSSLTYIGANGQTIIRPPGLSDLPGGAAAAGMTSAILGMALALGAKGINWKSAAYLVIVGISLTTVYLTQVRVLLIGAIFGMALSAWAAGQLNVFYRIRILATGAAVFAAAFLLAMSIGGKAIANRFGSLTSQDPLQTYQSNRGVFIMLTLDTYLHEYPLGAGVGRWGMMRQYAKPYLERDAAKPLYAEIQLTGWLYDGGVLMWIFYGAAIGAALLYAYRKARHHEEREVRYLAGLVLAMNMVVFLCAWDAPAFNDQFGIQFWTLTSALAGVCLGVKSSNLPREEVDDLRGRVVFAPDRGW